MKDFLRKTILTFVIINCFLWGFVGVCKAYSSIRQIGFGEYRSAIEIGDGKIKIFDYNIKT